jgi:hypothetical protein
MVQCEILEANKGSGGDDGAISEDDDAFEARMARTRNLRAGAALTGMVKV